VTQPRASDGVAGRGRVIVVGSVNIDLVARCERLPGPGETVIGASFAQHHGGKGGNQAVAAARLGAAVTFVGAVGRDAFGEQARGALEAEGIDTQHLAVIDETATGVALILVDAAGENSIAVASGANGRVAPAQVLAAMTDLRPTRGDVVLVGHEIPTKAARAALEAGRAAGATTVLNPAPATGLSADILALADIATPNEGEAAVLAAAGARAGITVTSRGAAGAWIEDGRGSRVVPAPRVDAVDTVGAGDTLNGALAAALAEGRALDEAVRRAVAAASLAVTRPGARGGMPRRGELDEALG
jgi:ribokinase